MFNRKIDRRDQAGVNGLGQRYCHRFRVNDPVAGPCIVSKYHDGVRMQLPPDPVRDAAELGETLQDPPLPDGVNLVGLTPSFLVIHRTEIGRYAN